MNKFDYVEEILTPAAKVALAELLENYKDKILFGAIKSASSATGTLDEISIRDILNGEKETQTIQSGVKSPRTERLIRSLMAGGILYTIAGFGYVIYTSTGFKLSPTELASLVVGIVGMIITIVAYNYPSEIERVFLPILFDRHKVNQDTESKDISWLIVITWQQIELAVKNLASTHLGESTANRPISFLIKELRHAQVLDSTDEKSLRELLSVRNKILHEGEKLSSNEFLVLYKNAEKLKRKLVEQEKG